MTYVIIALVSLVGVLAAWSVGWIVGLTIGQMLALTAVIVGLGLIGAFVVWLMLRLKTKQAGAVKDSTSSAGDLAMSKATIKAQTQRWKELQTALRASHLEDVVMEHHPWYLLIGAPRSGKTSLLQHSGLGFTNVGGSGRTGGIDVQPTTSFEWWRTEQSLFVDTAGKYLVDAGARREWLHLLGLIRSHRRTLPLQGIVLCVPVGDVLRKGSAGLSEDCQSIRDRLDEITNALGVTVPLYVVFTKCDTIGGFKDFFASITRQEKEQVLGSTMAWPLTTDLMSLFQNEHQRLVEALGVRRMLALAQVRGDEPQKKLFQFPLQFKALQSLLQDFVSSLFRIGLRETAILRGFYFTSCFHHQQLDAGPSAVAAAPATANAGVDKSVFIQGAGSAAMPGIGGPSADARLGFFINDLLAKVVIADQTLAHPTRRASQQQRHLRFLCLVAAPIIAAIGCTTVGMGIWRAISVTDELRMPSQLVIEVEAAAPREPLRNLEALDKLADRIAAIERLDDDRLRPVREGALNLHLRRLRELLLDPCVRVIQSDIEQLRSVLQRGGREIPAGAQDEIYDLYRTYQMMGGAIAVDAPVIRRTLEAKRRWLTGIEPGQVKCDFRCENLAKRQLESYINALSAGYGHIQTDRRMVDGVTRELGEGLWIGQAYDDLIRTLSAQFQVARADTLLSGPERAALTIDHEFNLVFSQMAWDEVVKKAISEKAEALERTFKELDNPRTARELARRLTDRYVEDHNRHWLTLITSMRAAQVRDFRDSPEQISRIAGRDSPYPDFIRNAFRQLSLNVAGLAIVSIGEDTSWIEQALQAISELRKDAQEYISSTQVGQRSADVEKLKKLVSRFNAVHGRIGELLINLPAERRNAVLKGAENILLSLFASLDQEFAAEQDRRWVENVYRPFNELYAKRFPFDKQAAEEVPHAEFSKFLNPTSGLIWASILPIEQLRSIKILGRPTVTLSSEYENTLRNLNQVREILFSGNSETLNAPFIITLGQREGVDDMAFSLGPLSFGLYDRPDAKFTTVFKQTESSSARISIHVVTNQWFNESVDKQDWSLLRLFNKGDPKLQPKGSYLFTWPFVSQAAGKDVVFKACVLLEPNGFEKVVVGDILSDFRVPERIYIPPSATTSPSQSTETKPTVKP
jgi:type VI protein secretion system component VasK